MRTNGCFSEELSLVDRFLPPGQTNQTEGAVKARPSKKVAEMALADVQVRKAKNEFLKNHPTDLNEGPESELEMKKWFILAGFGIGCCPPIALIVYAFRQFPGAPGPSELLLLAASTLGAGGIGAALGFVVGLAVELLLRLRTAKRDGE
jgi:hypothetical protein